MIEIDRNYINRQRHDEIIREKNKSIEEIKEEMLKKELEWTKEIAVRTRTNDDRKAKEYENMFANYKGNSTFTL